MANVAKVAVQYIGPSDVLRVQTFHVMAPDSGPVIDVGLRAGLCNAVWRWWMEDNGHDSFVAQRDVYPESFFLHDVTAWTIEPAPSGPTVRMVDEFGTGIDVLYPPALCWCVGLRTLTETRRGRGRMYLPATEDTAPDVREAGGIPLTLAESLGKMAQHLAYEIRKVGADEPDDGPLVLAVYSRVDQDAHPVIDFAIGDRLSTQRRRQPRATNYLHVGLEPPP